MYCNSTYALFIKINFLSFSAFHSGVYVTFLLLLFTDCPIYLGQNILDTDSYYGQNLVPKNGRIRFHFFLLLRLLADTGSLIIRPLSFWNRRCYHNGFNYSVISSQSPNRQIPCHQMAYFAQPI